MPKVCGANKKDNADGHVPVPAQDAALEISHLQSGVFVHAGCADVLFRITLNCKARLPLKRDELFHVCA